MYYNKQGKKIELMAWAKLLENRDYKIVKQETLSNGKFVSTVWLGLDYSFGDNEPLIFETMVFEKKNKLGDENDMNRYSTLKEAINGHKKMVKKHK